MSDEEQQFESKGDEGPSKTFPWQTGTNSPEWFHHHQEQALRVSTSKTGKHGHAKCHFLAIDMFNGKKLEDIVPSYHKCYGKFLFPFCLSWIKDGFAEGKELVVTVMTAMGEEQTCATKNI
ncbi:eukaryotic translation initiation factor 5A-2-like [Ziziphus jujuba]|uniref:Eukaryotic translation initiation factor 5A-2-like n=1 Tax=Ziziphus jujuba TaxID=326968 RepID=A0ABM3ZX11_ZIZJJ|nr:eukaryotic translation initiation factor 5A-2-like [Ziziphus jujuba]